MFLLHFLLLLLVPFPSALAQSSTSASVSQSASPTTQNQNRSSTLASGLTILTTTIVSTPTSAPSGSDSGSIPSAQASTYVLTLTLNSTNLSSSNINSTINSTIANGNSTNTTTAVAWNETDQWIPFHIALDPAYGTLGGVLIISGIPVAVLGGKNRWSSLAIASGYGLMLFTLVLILRFGVEPNLQPPSPNPPSTTLRGLYLLACLISSFFGGALGIFLYNFAQYWVSAAGGFAFGWYLLATKAGGLIHTVLGRWGLLGGLTVGAFIASLPKILNPHMMLISTAWIGATAFTLGVDCYTRAGLKEFYIYNLGFHDLFPKLNGGKYPLTQTMEIELGILAAVVLIGAAIQFRILNILQKRLKQMREEEVARIEAEEVEKAAERFRNVGAELNEWEEKYGDGNGTMASRNGGGSGSGGHLSPTSGETKFGSGTFNGRGERSSVALPQLGFSDDPSPRRDGRPSSTFSLLRNVDSRGTYEGVGANSPGLPGPDTPSSANFMGIEELKSPHDSVPSPTANTNTNDPELESKLRLLEEVKRAREEVRGSLDKLRATTPTPTIGGLSDIPLAGNGNGHGARTTTPTPSIGGLSDGRSQRLSTTSSRILDYSNTPAAAVANQKPQPERTASLNDWNTYLAERKVYTPPSTELLLARTTSTPGYFDRREKTLSMLEPRVSDFGPTEQLRGNGETHGTYPIFGSAHKSGSEPRERTMSGRPATYHDYLNQTPSGNNLGTPIIIGNATSLSRPRSQVFAPQQRAMTYEELAERHRKRLSKFQEPVTAKMKEQVDIAEAKAKWERQQRLEKETMRRREASALAPGEKMKEEGQGIGRPRERGKEKDVLKSTDEWRKSVVMTSPPAMALAPGSGSGGRNQRRQSTNYFAS